MKTFTVVGARPQFVKAAVVSQTIEEFNQTVSTGECIEEVLVHTGQHYDDNMSDIFFKEMQIPVPRYHLGIRGGTHGTMTGRMLESLEGLMLEEKPDVVFGLWRYEFHPGRCTGSSQTAYSGCPC